MIIIIVIIIISLTRDLNKHKSVHLASFLSQLARYIILKIKFFQLPRDRFVLLPEIQLLQ